MEKINEKSTAKQIRARDRSVVAVIKEAGGLSLRKLGELCGLSKDRVYRALKARQRRQVHKESVLWESELAQQWLHRMLFALIVTFVLEGGIGAERISMFLHRVRLEKEIGSSPTALRRCIKEIEDMLIQYAKTQEAMQKGKLKHLVAGGDETFFGNLLILVLMDISSGYILLEDITEDRRFETWQDAVSKRLEELGCEVRLFTSDRGKALIKLALEEFGCEPGADLFHAMHDLSSWQGLEFHRRQEKAKKAVQEAEAKLAKLDEQGVNGKVHEQAEHGLKQAQGAEYKAKQGHKQYRDCLHGISKVLHPFTLDSHAQTSTQAEKQLNAQLSGLEQVARDHAIDDRRGVVNKFKRQIKDLCGRVNGWWAWVTETLAELQLQPEYQDWAQHSLLPVVYWEQQITRADTPELRTIYSKAHENALQAWQSHPLTQSVAAETMTACQQWAQTMTARFQRSSSAIEGRNGCLAQMYHNTRGLSARRLKTLTVLHNFVCRRRDGSTPAERLFGTSFPDVFEWLLEQAPPLPVPRKARQIKLRNPLNIAVVAA